MLLRKHPPEAQAFILRSCKLVKTQAGNKVYTQGAAADSWYIIESGRYRATQRASDGVAEQVVREFGPLQTFGSHELIAGLSSRCETVHVLEDGAVWVLAKKTFDAKLRVAPAPAPSLVERVRAIPLFDGFTHEQLTLVCRAAVDVKIDKRGYKLCGDVDFEEASKVASAITPVPGGVGPMTIAMLLKNTLNLARHSVGLPRLPLRKNQDS